jgi:hypothetical protein
VGLNVSRAEASLPGPDGLDVEFLMPPGHGYAQRLLGKSTEGGLKGAVISLGLDIHFPWPT